MSKRRKPKEYLYVDAYNVINHWDITREKLAVSLEEARYTLLEILSEYSAYQGVKIIIVFDAYRVDRAKRIDSYKGIDIVYTEENQTADQYIERELDRYGKRRKITVATSDRTEQEIILAKGGIRISAAELEVNIYNARNTVRRNMKKLKLERSLALNRIDDDTARKLYEYITKL